MYQFYYADEEKKIRQAQYQKNICDEFLIEAIRPTVWEEHCLECSAPVCFGNCAHYLPRIDGRCMRFENGIFVYKNEKGCGNQAARVKFRKWANMMTIIFPGMMTANQYEQIVCRNQKLGNWLKLVLDSKLPRVIRWNCVRIVEFLRRKKLRNMTQEDSQPDAFVFHGYSFEKSPFHLILEVFDDHTPVFKTSIELKPGENLYILSKNQLSDACLNINNLVKIYPENNKEAELDILWCDFVKGHGIVSEQPSKNVKGLVWDLDNTIWDGTLIETEDPGTIQLRENVLDVIKALDERGIIQSVASKNDYEAAYPIIEKLGIAEYFLYPQIHWNAKSGSMEQIAKSLNIGIDSLALIDDSVFERNQVQSALPQVRVYDATEVDKLLEYPEFDVMITGESKNRRAMYRAEEKRNQLMQSDNTDTVEFIKKCHLRMEIFSPKTEEEKQRCYELVVRTNQLNMSGVKYTPEEFERVIARENHTNFAFSYEDDFGKYGIVGFGQYKVDDGVLVFTEFAMSCRVAGKFVESALLEALLSREHCEKGSFEVRITKKNALLRRALEEIGFLSEFQTSEKVKYSFTDQLKNSEIVCVCRR